MKRGALAESLVGVMAAAMGTSCTTPNPAYEDGGDGPTGAASASAEDATIDAPITEGSSSSTSDGSADGESGAIPTCGNGSIEVGEDCDDGNAIDGDGCSAGCQISDGVAWLVEFEPVVGADHGFLAAAQLEGDLLAAGRSQLTGDPTTRAVVVRFDRDTGDEVEVAGLEGAWPRSEAQGLHASPGRLYIAGTAQRPDTSISALVACFDVAETITSSTCWSVEVSGGRGRGLLLHEGSVIVALGGLDDSGHGLAVVEENGAAMSWLEDSQMGDSQFDAMAVVGGEPVVGGMKQWNAVVAHVGPDQPSTVDFITESGTGPGPDRVRALVELDGDVVVGGSKDQEGTARDVWAGRYRLDGTLVWAFTINGGSLDADEIEALALDPEGNVIAVGMMGAPSIPRVWKIDGASGAVVWTRAYPGLGPGDASFRGVAVDEAIFVVGERRVNGGSVGIAARLVP